MENVQQKIVSPEVAEILKNMGYPIKEFDIYGNEVDVGKGIMYQYPTYLDVWMWLWKYKSIHLTPVNKDGVVSVYFESTAMHDVKKMELTDPERALEESIKIVLKYINEKESSGDNNQYGDRTW